MADNSFFSIIIKYITKNYFCLFFFYYTNFNISIIMFHYPQLGHLFPKVNFCLTMLLDEVFYIRP